MSTNLPANEQEANPAQNPMPDTNSDKADLKPPIGIAKPDLDPNLEADKAEVKKFNE